MKSDNFYHLKYSDYCLHLHCYTHNVSANMSFNLLVFHVEFGDLHRTLNCTVYLIHGGDCSISINHDWVQVLSYSNILSDKNGYVVVKFFKTIFAKIWVFFLSMLKQWHSEMSIKMLLNDLWHFFLFILWKRIKQNNYLPVWSERMFTILFMIKMGFIFIGLIVIFVIYSAMYLKATYISSGSNGSKFSRLSNISEPSS